MKQTTKHFLILFALIWLVLLLAGCGGAAFSPADVAVRNVMERHEPGFTVDPNSIQVLQQVKLNDEVVVMVQYRGTRSTTGEEECLFTYRVEKSWLGSWHGGSGGGSCSSGLTDPEVEPISIGAGISTGGSVGDIGESEVSGLVNKDDIVSVRVTWDDNQAQTVDVINGTYLVVREGQFHMSNVEAFNADGEVVYSNEPQFAPGKQ